MDLSRRKALLLGSSLGTVLISGCAELPFINPQLTLTLLNFDTQPHILSLEMLRAEGRERSESVVLTEQFELQPPTNGNAAYELQKPNILGSRKYVVRAELDDNTSTRDNYIFYPDCTRDDEPPEELYVEIHRDAENEQPYILFQQNLCGRDSWQF